MNITIFLADDHAVGIHVGGFAADDVAVGEFEFSRQSDGLNRPQHQQN